MAAPGGREPTTIARRAATHPAKSAAPDESGFASYVSLLRGLRSAGGALVTGGHPRRRGAAGLERVQALRLGGTGQGFQGDDREGAAPAEPRRMLPMQPTRPGAPHHRADRPVETQRAVDLAVVYAPEHFGSAPTLWIEPWQSQSSAILAAGSFERWSCQTFATRSHVGHD